jgi:hypothetical protein
LVDVATVNRYSIEGRYPGDWEPITPEHAGKALAVAKRVKDAVRSALPPEITE